MLACPGRDLGVCVAPVRVQTHVGRSCTHMVLKPLVVAVTTHVTGVGPQMAAFPAGSRKRGHVCACGACPRTSVTEA